MTSSRSRHSPGRSCRNYRERVVSLCTMGDGGFDMVLGELATLRDLSLPVTIVVFDDSSFNLVTRFSLVSCALEHGAYAALL